VSEKAEEGDVHPEGLSEVVADKGYHSDRILLDLESWAIRSYLSASDRGRRNWKDDVDAQQAVYANRRRIRGERGKRLHRMRGELIERPFAHLYETGAMRRTHLRGHPNILKRLLIHTAAFNLGLLMRMVFGAGTPRGLQGTLQPLLGLLTDCTNVVGRLLDELAVHLGPFPVPQSTLEPSPLNA
jgi:hypothetical protein